MYFFLKKQKKGRFCLPDFTISFLKLLRQSKSETHSNICIRGWERK